MFVKVFKIRAYASYATELKKSNRYFQRCMSEGYQLVTAMRTTI